MARKFDAMRDARRHGRVVDKQVRSHINDAWRRRTPENVAMILVPSIEGGGECVKVYGRMIRPTLRGADDPKLTEVGVDDPIGHMADAFDDRQSVDAALRVVTWAYYSFFANRVAAEMTYDDFIEGANAAFGTTTSQEVAAQHLLFEIESAPAEEMRVTYERRIFALTLGAAIGREVSPDDVWVGVALPAWGEAFDHGQSFSEGRFAAAGYRFTDEG
jgi:hypothetical protein